MSATLKVQPATADQHMHAIQAAAQHLAEALAHGAQADAQVAEAKGVVQHIAGLIQAREEDKAAILARRNSDQARDDDAGQMMLIAADVEGLVAESQAALQAVDRAMVPQAQAAHMVSAAQQTLARLEAEAEEQAIVTFLTDADNTLVQALDRLKQLHRELGRGAPAWAPSHALITELRGLRLRAGGLA